MNVNATRVPVAGGPAASPDAAGAFVISLDFELHGGVSETRRVEDYRVNLDGTRTAIRGMLKLFRRHAVRATWATVGLLFCKSKKEILARIDGLERPGYRNAKLSNYLLLDSLGADVSEDPYHFGSDVLEDVRECPGQEIGTHTFSHYYCLEEGPTDTSFEVDLALARAVAAEHHLQLRSMVFPRNQYSERHLAACSRAGIHAYRGNPGHWLYRSLASEHQHLLRRAGRLLDAYLPVSGTLAHPPAGLGGGPLVNVPASRFLRPYSSRWKGLEPIRLRRIKNEMTAAAAGGRLYHLWWHPHNFGRHVPENLAFLEAILEHHGRLSSRYRFPSLTMYEASQLRSRSYS
jgi:hypothetical protein